MRKILMRSAMPLNEDKTISDVLFDNLVGSNTGNLIFQHSLARVVMTEDTEITMIKTSRPYPQEQIDQWNQEYDMFLIPLANAFRVSFQNELRQLTNLVRKLKIPCVVVGVGFQKGINSDKWEFEFDNVVKDFVKAVLEKSSIIGLRGDATAEYLNRLGFKPEQDYTVIGCPSMYTFGDSLPKPRPTDLSTESKVTLNYKIGLPKDLYQFLRKQEAQFKHSVFISQVIPEIKILYAGYFDFTKKSLKKVPSDYPIHMYSDIQKNDEMVGVVDDISWLNFLKQQDFNFGSRIHGNIISILAGTPCYIFAGDYRVKELAEYHHIPHMSVFDIKEDTNVIDLYHKTDYSQLMIGHKERVSHYLDFLDKNGVQRIDRETLNQPDTPFDKMYWNAREGLGVIHPFSTISPEEQEKRLREYYLKLKRRIKEVDDLEKELLEIKNSRSYKFVNRFLK